MSLSLWRDISVVWLSVLCLIALVVPLGIAYFAVIGMHRVLNVVPGYLERSQRLSASLRTKTVDVSQRVAEPVLAGEQKMTRWTTTWRKLWRTAAPYADVAGKEKNYAD